MQYEFKWRESKTQEPFNSCLMESNDHSDPTAMTAIRNVTREMKRRRKEKGR